ncbi:response regulator [Catenovulum agarivorans]|uniref:response regulator n=1 Tax=Catenovulum agarivorans TaxID=1172192 RepID=UPI00031DBEB0|nr:response regulator [Catenovulum agarivorans]
MAGKRALASRHPQVVLIHSVDLESGAAVIVSQHMEDFRAFKEGEQAINAIKEFKPKILLLELNSVKESIAFYVSLVKEHNLLTYPHQVVLLCGNKEAGLAYAVCAKGSFYDYFVSRPIYEKFRLKSILNNLSKMLQIQEEATTLNDSYINALDTDIDELISEANSFQQNIHNSIENCRSALVNNGGHNNGDGEDVTEVLTPLISQIEDEVRKSLQAFIANLAKQKKTNKSHHQQLKKSVTAECKFIKDIPIEDTDGTTEAESDAPPSEELLKQAAEEQNEEAARLLAEQALLDNSILLGDEGAVEQAEKPKPKKILVVEDNHIYRDMIKKILSSAGYYVVEAANGMEAIKESNKLKFDLILMDLFMPELDGLNATKQFRKRMGKKDLPILALTGNKNKDLVVKWVSSGINGYIMKPSSKEKIIQAVEEAIHKKEARSS